MNIYHAQECEFYHHQENGLCFNYAIYHDEGDSEYYTCTECKKEFGGIGKFDTKGDPIKPEDNDYQFGTIRGVKVGEGWDEDLCNDCFSRKASAKLVEKLLYAQEHQWDAVLLEYEIEDKQKKADEINKNIPEFLKYTYA